MFYSVTAYGMTV